MGGMRLMKAVLQLRFMIMKEYKSNTYNACTNDDEENGKLWCATGVIF